MKPTQINHGSPIGLGARAVQRVPTMLMPSVDRYMTREPYAVVSTDTLAFVKNLMHVHSIRHVPVVDDGRLVGMISERDISIVQAVPGVDLTRLEVSQVMSPPLPVWSTTPLDEVSELMTQRRSDCVVVQGGLGVEGIFTASDALTALADLLRRATA